MRRVQNALICPQNHQSRKVLLVFPEKTDCNNQRNDETHKYANLPCPGVRPGVHPVARPALRPGWYVTSRLLLNRLLYLRTRERSDIINATFGRSCSKTNVSLTTRGIKTVPFTPFTPGALQFIVGYCSHFDIMLGTLFEAIHANPHDDFIR